MGIRDRGKHQRLDHAFKLLLQARQAPKATAPLSPIAFDRRFSFAMEGDSINPCAMASHQGKDAQD